MARRLQRNHYIPIHFERNESCKLYNGLTVRVNDLVSLKLFTRMTENSAIGR